MALTNLRLIKDEQTIQDRARAAIDAYHLKSAENRIASDRNFRPRHLDVDAVLARSLPKLTTK